MVDVAPPAVLGNSYTVDTSSIFLDGGSSNEIPIPQPRSPGNQAWIFATIQANPGHLVDATLDIDETGWDLVAELDTPFTSTPLTAPDFGWAACLSKVWTKTLGPAEANPHVSPQPNGRNGRAMCIVTSPVTQWGAYNEIDYADQIANGDPGPVGDYPYPLQDGTDTKLPLVMVWVIMGGTDTPTSGPSTYIAQGFTQQGAKLGGQLSAVGGTAGVLYTKGVGFDSGSAENPGTYTMAETISGGNHGEAPHSVITIAAFGKHEVPGEGWLWTEGEGWNIIDTGV